MDPSIEQLIKDLSAERSYRRRLKYRVLNSIRYRADVARGDVRVKTFRAAPVLRVGLISDLLAYCSDCQYYPFDHYRSKLLNRRSIASMNLMLEDALRSPAAALQSFDCIVLKLTYRTPRKLAATVVQTIREATPGKRLIYFDGDDDICVQWPEILPSVDSYVKKHVFRDRRNYCRNYYGKSNLHDYVHREFNFNVSPLDFSNRDDGFLITSTDPVPRDQLDKIALGYNIALDKEILGIFQSMPTGPEKYPFKDLDIVFRGSVKNQTVLRYLRRDIEPKLRELESDYRLLITSARVPRTEYYKEMMRSRLCVSPFGFGEICWRDFEAVLFGCLLIKPSMDHVETSPDIFIPNETYVPVRWDFSDLAEKCRYYLEHEKERRRITQSAFQVLREYYLSDRFCESAANLLLI